MTSQQILSANVSFQPTSWGRLGPPLTVGEVLGRIASGSYSLEIAQLRHYLANGQSETYDQQKKRLGAVTFSALFSGRRNRAQVVSYNNLLVLDIDKLSPLQLEQLRLGLTEDKYVFSFWVSPSEAGIKGLVYLKYMEGFDEIDINSRHRYAFKKVSEYILERYDITIDQSGSDITRLCFFSHDPNILIRDNVVPFVIDFNSEELKIISRTSPDGGFLYSSAPTRDQQYNPLGRNRVADREYLQGVIRFLSKRDLSITHSFEKWFQVCYAIANTFTYEIGSKYYLALCKMDKDKFKEVECRDMLDYCYANSQRKFSFATIVYFAKQVGYKEEKRVPKAGEVS